MCPITQYLTLFMRIQIFISEKKWYSEFDMDIYLNAYQFLKKKTLRIIKAQGIIEYLCSLNLKINNYTKQICFIFIFFAP